MVEKEAVPGDVIEVSNGNRYLVLPDLRQAYVGNKSLRLSEGLVEPRLDNSCKLVGRVVLPKYEDHV